MTDDLQTNKTSDGYELRSDGRIVGALIWAPQATGDRPAPGWWLDVLGCRPDLISEVPAELAGDLESARRATESASLGFAELILVDRLAGLLDPI